MNNLISFIIMMTLGIFVTFNAAIAAERVKVFELAESGMVIEFPMTAAEIAAEDAERERLAAVRAARSAEPEERLEKIELAESGEVYEFPMTAAEIAAEDTENTRRAAMLGKNSNSVKAPVVVFELAESGQRIEFTVTSDRSEPALQDSDIARGNPKDRGVSLR